MVKSFSKIAMPDSFAKLLFATQSQLGGSKVANKMRNYVFGERQDKITVFDTEKTWDKFILAARAFAGIQHPETISVISGKTFGRKPVLKFAEAVSCKPYTGRFIPGLLQIQILREVSNQD